MKNKEQIIQSFNEKREEQLSSISTDFIETSFVKVDNDFIKGIGKNNNLSEKFIPLFKDFGETNLVLSLSQDSDNNDSCVDIVRCNRCYINSNGEKKGLDQDQIEKQFYFGLEAFFKAGIVNEANVYHIAEIFSDHDIFLDSPGENQRQVDFSSNNGQKFCLSTYSEGKYPDESSRYVGLKLEIKKEPLNFEKNNVQITPSLVDKIKEMVDISLDVGVDVKNSVRNFLPFLEKYKNDALSFSREKINTDSGINLPIIVGDKDNFEEFLELAAPSMLKADIADEEFINKVKYFCHFANTDANFSAVENSVSKDISFIDEKGQKRDYCLHTVSDGDKLGLVVSVSRCSIDGLANK